MSRMISLKGFLVMVVGWLAAAPLRIWQHLAHEKRHGRRLRRMSDVVLDWTIIAFLCLGALAACFVVGVLAGHLIGGAR